MGLLLYMIIRNNWLIRSWEGNLLSHASLENQEIDETNNSSSSSSLYIYIYINKSFTLLECYILSTFELKSLEKHACSKKPILRLLLKSLDCIAIAPLCVHARRFCSDSPSLSVILDLIFANFFASDLIFLVPSSYICGVLNASQRVSAEARCASYMSS